MKKHACGSVQLLKKIRKAIDVSRPAAGPTGGLSPISAPASDFRRALGLSRHSGQADLVFHREEEQAIAFRRALARPMVKAGEGSRNTPQDAIDFRFYAKGQRMGTVLLARVG